MLPALYLLPVTLGDTPVETVLPSYNKEVILGIRYFIVEDVRSARRFLKKVDREIDIDSLTFYTLNKHTSPEDISGYLMPLEDGNSMGVISEAGCPAVADPGADVVAIAQRKNLRVIPLVGPSSIILSVMGSGFNGQSFAFHGYLPIEPGERAKKLKALEQRVYNEHQTQLFIEMAIPLVRRRGLEPPGSPRGTPGCASTGGLCPTQRSRQRRNLLFQTGSPDPPALPDAVRSSLIPLIGQRGLSTPLSPS